MHDLCSILLRFLSIRQAEVTWITSRSNYSIEEGPAPALFLFNPKSLGISMTSISEITKLDFARRFSSNSSEGEKQYDALYDVNSERIPKIAVGGLSDMSVIK